MLTASWIESATWKYQALASEMDERTRRLWAASEARALGYGGITAIAQATGMAISTIRAGLRELAQPAPAQACVADVGPRHVRRPGAGRKALAETDPRLAGALEVMVASTTRGDPMSPLRWTCKSTRVLAKELTGQGHPVSHATVAGMLDDLGYSLQGNRKTRGGDPVEARVHDFQDKTLGKAIPYGVFDMTRNKGWVSVGTDHDTAEFAVQTIRHWWRHMGRRAYPRAHELLVTADGGGSNGSRNRLWKVALQKFADEAGGGGSG